MLAFMIKACVTALKQYPQFNSSLDKSGESLIIKHYYHIGVAVDTPGGTGRAGRALVPLEDAQPEYPLSKPVPRVGMGGVVRHHGGVRIVDRVGYRRCRDRRLGIHVGAPDLG